MTSEHAHTLTRHRDIQAWVSDRKGMPALVPSHNRFGEKRARLTLKFDRSDKPRGMPEVDQGASPISWAAWLAELDRQQLALRVSPGGDIEYEFVERKTLN
jgi:hypothetical protein